MKKHILLLIFLSTFLFSNTKVTLQLSWLHQFQFAGYYIAKEKGYYKELGIDVEIKEFEHGINLTEVVSQKKADFAVGRSSLLIHKYNGKDIVALGAIYQSSPLMLLVTKKSGIETIEDFKSKRIMITSDARSAASIIAMLNSKGVGLEDVIVQKHSFNLEDLINGKTDAMASYVSNEPIRLAERNIEYKIFHPKDYGFRFYDDILFTSSQFIKNNPKLTKDFLDATLRGWDYAFKNIGETSEVIHSKYNSQNKTKIQLVKEGESLRDLVCNYEDSKIGCIDKDILKEIAQTYKVLGLMDDNIDLDSFVYEHNPHKYYEFKLNDSDIIFLVVISVLLITLVFSTILYSSIKTNLLHTNKELKDEVEKSKEKIQKQKDEIEFQFNKLNNIINSSVDIIVFKDENLNYLHCNEHFAKLFGKTPEDIIGKDDYYLFDKEIADFIRAIDKGVIDSNEIRIDKDWVKFPNVPHKQLFHSVLKPLEYEGGKIGLIIFSSDRTNEYQLEEEKEKSQQLLLEHSKIASISKLLQNISHQWRQPLSSISMDLNNIKMEINLNSQVNKKEINTYIDTSLNQLQYISKIINDFSSYLDNKEVGTETLETKNLFNQFFDMLESDFSENNVKLVKNIENIKINHNVSLLIQSLMSIYKNSLDAFDINRVNKSDRYIFTTVKELNDKVVFQLKDSGDGIKDEMLNQLFEPYTTTKHKYIGVGLSLYITYHIIVDLLGGEISVENTSYTYENKDLKGAQFTIVVPKVY